MPPPVTLILAPYRDLRRARVASFMPLHIPNWLPPHVQAPAARATWAPPEKEGIAVTVASLHMQMACKGNRLPREPAG